LKLPFELRIGHSPAIQTWVAGELFPYDGHKDVEGRCQDLRESNRGTGGGAQFTFPIFQSDVITTKRQIRMRETGFDHRKFFPALIICSEYKFQFESGLHHTDAWYFITRIGEVPCNCARMITQTNLIDRYSRDEAESPPPPYTLGVEFPSDAIKSTDLFLYRESLDDIVID
jgi:hypothetical protein